MGKVIAICTSKKKGTVKNEIASASLIKDHGVEGDAHAGSGRQVSLLSYEKFTEFRKRAGERADIVPGVFGENLLVEGFDFRNLKVGTRFKCGEALLELMQIGKKCHTGCAISKITGECIMPVEGVFAKVMKSGTVNKGDSFEIIYEPSGRAPYRACIITASDRSFRGEREDLSGPKIEEIIMAQGYYVVSRVLLSDDEEGIYRELVKLTDENSPDVIFTTGGTGFSPRDHMPEATKRAADKDAPGIAEAIRAYSLKITPNAMLSRGVSVIRGKTLIINLPGSPKAVSECLEYILPSLEHGLGILRGELTD